jgi:hypothetical protein
MDTPAALLSIGWLIRDTFRQARTSGIFWLMLGVTAICVAVCASIGVEGDVPIVAEGPDRGEFLPRSDLAAASVAIADLVGHGASWSLDVWTVPLVNHARQYSDVTRAQRHRILIPQGQVTLAFGSIPTGKMTRDRTTAVRYLEGVLAGWVAGTMGVVLTLLWTAGFLPSFLDPAAVSVLLAKPAPRWSLLIGKYLGVVVFVAFQALVFVGGTWMALGMRTAVWDPAYWVCLPLLLVNFMVFFSFSVLLAVTTRSTVACAFGSILFWLLCWGMNVGRHAALGLTEFQSFGRLSELGYWLLPKPTDVHIVLMQTLGVNDFVTQQIKVPDLAAHGAWWPELSVLASMLAGVVLLALAAYEFMKADY